jgi:hypothetical protein
MPYDGSGNYSLPDGYLAVSGEDILPENHNPPLEDIGSALSQILLASGVRALTGNLSAGNNKITNLGTPTGDSDAARLQDIAPKIFIVNKGGTNQSVEDGDKITFTNAVNNDDSLFDTGDSQFIPDNGKIAIISATVALPSVDGSDVQITLYKNNSAYQTFFVADTVDFDITSAIIVAFVVGNGTDYYDIRFTSSTAGAYTCYGASTRTVFQGIQFP